MAVLHSHKNYSSTSQKVMVQLKENYQRTISTTPICLLFVDPGFNQAISRKKTKSESNFQLRNNS